MDSKIYKKIRELDIHDFIKNLKKIKKVSNS